MSFDQTACDTCWRGALAGRDDDAHAIVATSSHGTAASVHHEAHQKPAGGNDPIRNDKERLSRVELSHAVIKTHTRKQISERRS